MVDFYVISISQIGTNRLAIETKDKKIGSDHCEIVKKRSNRMTKGSTYRPKLDVFCN